MKFLLFLFLTLTVYAADPFTHLERCTPVKADWPDGDSFPIRTAEGKEITNRLFCADCIEWHVTDETDARRLREQRRYFGISGFGGSPEKSIEAAKGLGAWSVTNWEHLPVERKEERTEIAEIELSTTPRGLAEGEKSTPTPPPAMN